MFFNEFTFFFSNYSHSSFDCPSDHKVQKWVRSTDLSKNNWLPYAGYPSCVQTMDAKWGSFSPPHTFPHVPLIQTRTIPALATGEANNSISPSVHRAEKTSVLSDQYVHVTLTDASQWKVIKMIAPSSSTCKCQQAAFVNAGFWTVAVSSVEKHRTTPNTGIVPWCYINAGPYMYHVMYISLVENDQPPSRNGGYSNDITTRCMLPKKWAKSEAGT